MTSTTTLAPSVANVLETLSRASVADLATGRSWYDDAHALARRLDPVDPHRAAGVLAALSPRMPWGRNVLLATRALEEGHASGALSRSVAAADEILSGTDPLDVLKGPKVRAFYRTIVDPSTDDVVVDRHAYDVAVGTRTDDVTRARALARKGGYDVLADVYRDAARLATEAGPFEWTPAQVQATTWVTHRREHGADRHDRA